MPTIALQSLHINQKAIIDGRKRFNVLKCGRRFGKTTLVERLASVPAIQGYPVGFWSPTYKDLSEVWKHMKYVLSPIIKSKDEQLKQIILVTGGVIDFWSMDDPDSGRGRKYVRIIVDEAEKAKKFKEAWNQTIRATLTDFKGDGWFLSTPKFGATYFKEMSSFARDFPDKYHNWASFHFTTYDNPFMSHEEIDEIRSQLDDLTFRCEFLAEDVDLVGLPFCYAFDEAKHVKPTTYDPTEPLCLAIDFNKDPLSAFVCQNPEIGTMNILKEYRLSNGDIFEMCEQLKTDWPDVLWYVTGDGTGHGRTAMVRGNTNYYTIIKSELGLQPYQMKQPRSNPSVASTRPLVNSLFARGNISIDPSCAYTIRDMKYVEINQDSDKVEILKDRSSDVRLSDFLDCFRYCAHTFHRKFIKDLPDSEDLE